MNIAIFGSCVSRDTCEFIPEAIVKAYVARHSMASLDAPHGTDDVDLDDLSSSFQVRMVTGDLEGNGVDRLVGVANKLDLVLLDLVDERRGYWLFPDNTVMTNSIEVELCGVGALAKHNADARLVEFGSDEHFAAWQNGFTILVRALEEAGILERAVLLDVEWAGAMAGAPHPEDTVSATLGRHWRRLQRGGREATRRLSRGAGVGEVMRQFRDVRPTETEEFADRAAQANADYSRYLDFAREKVPFVISRKSREVRIGPDHRWGPQPFHYRDEDYLSIVDEIRTRAEQLGVDLAGHGEVGKESPRQ
ncbi:MAG: DUF6270 domain-containing protein [Brevibacterium aurantiacum]|uniref:DUF6270 domain-containing protein n=1 Tax=Brevibacterium aurantiacum TaxID=273384 RepID=UPI003F8E5C82